MEKSIVSGSRSGSPPSSGVNHIDRASPSTGSSTPASAATSFDQTPAQQTTVSVAIRPSGVSTAAMRPPRTSTPVSGQPWRIVAPDADA